MSDQEKSSTTKEQLKAELAKWQTKIDEAKLQMHLGAKDAQGKLGPHVEQLEKEMDQAKRQLADLENKSGAALEDLKHGFKLSTKSMQKAFEKAQQHFVEDKE